MLLHTSASSPPTPPFPLRSLSLPHFSSIYVYLFTSLSSISHSPSLPSRAADEARERRRQDILRNMEEAQQQKLNEFARLEQEREQKRAEANSQKEAEKQEKDLQQQLRLMERQELIERFRLT